MKKPTLYEAKVNAGINFLLGRIRPGEMVTLAKRITDKYSVFDICEEHNCVLGFQYGSFHKGLRQLFFTEVMEVRLRTAVRYGFILPKQLSKKSVLILAKHSNMLTEEWLRQLRPIARGNLP